MSDFCPAIHEWWNSNVFRPFYQELVPFGNPDYRATPAAPLENRRAIKSVEHVTYGESLWCDAGIPIRWIPGPMSQPWPSAPKIMFDHWHTSFAIREHSIHIDFVSFFRMGPQTSYREYRVFCDEKEIKRGGGYAGFLGGNFTRQRNWPLAVEVDEHLIYICGFLQHWIGAVKGQIQEDAVCSVWERTVARYF